MPRITSVLFDFGNVLSLPQKRELVEEMSRLVGAPVERFVSAYAAHRREYDGGTLDAAAYWQRVMRSAGNDGVRIPDDELLRRLVAADIASWTQMRPSMIDWARSLQAAGFKVGVLSNMPPDHGEQILRDFAWLVAFDAIAFSYRLKLVKPDEAIYRAALQMLGSRPEESLFIDDIAENAEGARRVGMASIHFRDIDGLRAELCRYPELPLP